MVISIIVTDVAMNDTHSGDEDCIFECSFEKLSFADCQEGTLYNRYVL